MPFERNNFCPDQPSNTALSDRATSVYARCKDFSGLCWLVFPSPLSPSRSCARRSRELIPRQKGHRVSIAYSLWRAGRYLLAAHSTTIRARVYSRARKCSLHSLLRHCHFPSSFAFLRSSTTNRDVLRYVHVNGRCFLSEISAV